MTLGYKEVTCAILRCCGLIQIEWGVGPQHTGTISSVVWFWHNLYSTWSLITYQRGAVVRNIIYLQLWSWRQLHPRANVSTRYWIKEFIDTNDMSSVTQETSTEETNWSSIINTPGSACSSCPRGSSCSRQYPGLCTWTTTNQINILKLCCLLVTSLCKTISETGWNVIPLFVQPYCWNLWMRFQFSPTPSIQSQAS